MQLAEMLDDLPKHGDWGVRFEERGRKQRWKGYKLHCDLSDSGLPLSYVLTSASLHDSQAAIPLATLTSRRVTALYELMDAGYYGHNIRQYCEQLGHVVLIPDVPQRASLSEPSHRPSASAMNNAASSSNSLLC